MADKSWPASDGGAAIDMHQINDHWGVLSTGVIDPETKRVYLVAWISPDGTPQTCNFLYLADVRNSEGIFRLSYWPAGDNGQGFLDFTNIFAISAIGYHYLIKSAYRFFDCYQ